MPNFKLAVKIALTVLDVMILVPLTSLAMCSTQLNFQRFVRIVAQPEILSKFCMDFVATFTTAIVGTVVKLILT